MQELILDRNYAQELLKDKKYHKRYQNDKISAPFDTEQGIKTISDNIISEYNTNIAPLREQINTTTLQIETKEKELTKITTDINKNNLKSNALNLEIKQIESDYLTHFPTELHNQVKPFNYDPYELNFFLNKLPLLKRMFGFKKKKQEISKLYKKLAEKHKEQAPLTDEQGQLKQRANNLKNDIHQLHSKLSTLNTKAQKIYDDAHAKLHQDIASWIYTTTHLAKDHTPTLGLQFIKDPVCFMLDLDDTDANIDIYDLLKHAGLKIDNTPDGYTLDHTKNKKPRLITPFYDPKNARRNIDTIKKYLRFHGIKVVGVHPPLRHYQLNPNILINHESKSTNLTPEHIRNKLQKHIKNFDYITADELTRTYGTNGKYLFRGQTFMTGDPRSSYASITPRHGAAGISYATTEPFYATGYASLGLKSASGHTIDAENQPGLINPDTGIKEPIGLLTVFERSPRNVTVHNTELESIYSATNFKIRIQSGRNETFNFSETLLNPDDNKIVSRYIAYDGILIKINEQDPEWLSVLDYFAPNLHTTYGNSNTTNRIKNLENEYRSSQNTTNTYDLTPEQLEKMGYQAPAKKMTNATKSLKSKIAHSNQQILTATNTDDRAA